MAFITADQEQLLCALAAAYEVRGRTGERELFIFARSSGGTSILHDGLDGHEWDQRPGIGDLEELAAKGLLSPLDWRSQHSGNFRVTAEGLEHASRVRRNEAFNAEVGAPFDHVWETDLLPVLRAVVDTYRFAPASKGVSQEAVNERLGRSEGDAETDRTLYLLYTSGYIEGITADQVEGPMFSVPTEKAFQVTRGWPSQGGESAAAAFIAALEQAVRDAPSEDERTKRQQMLDIALDVGQSVLAGVLTKVATGV